MEDHEKNCVVLNAKKPQNLFLWRYIENTCILLLGERSKPAKKILTLKFSIFNMMRWVTQLIPFTISIKMSLLGMEGILVGNPMFGRKIFDIWGK